MSAAPTALTRTLDPESRRWLNELHAEGAMHEAAIERLHALLLREARYEVRCRAVGLAHPSGGDLDDLALQAADDALIAILAKLDQFRGEALFTTWARRFAALEVPGKIRRRLGHAHETPIAFDDWPPLDRGVNDDPQQRSEASELARAVGYLIAHELTGHQRDVLLALTVEEIATKKLAVRLDSTPAALYKTLHDARRKLRCALAPEQEAHQHQRSESGRMARPPRFRDGGARPPAGRTPVPAPVAK